MAPRAKSKAPELTIDQRRTLSALAARAKSVSGGKLTHREARDLAWLRDQDREEILTEVLTKFPKRLYGTLAGLQQKSLDDQALQFNLPLRGATIDLGDLLHSFHDLLSQHANKFSSDIDDRNALECEKLRAQIAQMEHRTQLLQLDLAREKSDTIQRADIRHRLKWLSDQLRQFGDGLGKRFGADAQKSLNNLLDKLEREIRDGTLSMDAIE